MAKWVKGLLYKLNDPSSMPATHIKVEGRESSPQRCHLISISMLWYPSPQHHTYTPKNNNKNVIWMVGKYIPDKSFSFQDRTCFQLIRRVCMCVLPFVSLVLEEII